jgi:small nuclear ribonucleoprotein (snRNP)-like protein
MSTEQTTTTNNDSTTTTTSSSNNNTNSELETLKREFLGATVRMVLKDDRIISGILEVVDGDRNVILKNSAQINAGPQKNISLPLHYAMIPGHAIVEVHVATPTTETNVTS